MGKDTISYFKFYLLLCKMVLKHVSIFLVLFSLFISFTSTEIYQFYLCITYARSLGFHEKMINIFLPIIGGVEVAEH